MQYEKNNLSFILIVRKNQLVKEPDKNNNQIPFYFDRNQTFIFCAIMLNEFPTKPIRRKMNKTLDCHLFSHYDT